MSSPSSASWAPKLLGLAPDEAAIEAVLPKAHAVFEETLRGSWAPSATSPAMHFTLADVMIAPQMDFLSPDAGVAAR